MSLSSNYVKYFSLNTNQILLWMYNALIVSIIKSTIALFCTYLFSYYISKNKIISLLISFILLCYLCTLDLQFTGHSLVILSFGYHSYY